MPLAQKVRDGRQAAISKIKSYKFLKTMIRLLQNQEKKVCQICVDGGLDIDYKNEDLLRKFISPQGRILPRKKTGACAFHQRKVSRAVKRARIAGILPFVVK